LASLPGTERERIWTKLTEAVEATFQGRAITEGWQAVNERKVEQSLTSFINEGQADDFITFSSGDYYIQFAYEGKERVYCEAVSDCYLPPTSQLSNRAALKLQSLGFAPPEDNESNYDQVFYEANTKKGITRIAKVVIEAFSDAYMVSRNADLSIVNSITFNNSYGLQ